ncbi:site-specific integrase [Mucilaginibacter rubeus]|uniref:Site-specific integrase n=1 Tax=Mucilaginibacter rubeus TaxID=2027860 RepID=A0AAE6JCM7_9SPHI|nr:MULTISPECIES: site-specific integrase [Mucilaginibacter]QEM03133.1 site-specific integrase [Mucilaginibacter rubeus]QEM15751.1 site-specific integrase [Mucilaginibacter gossypii]QTE41508.1 site-specific integrase [Mucilaginibacter rubeus]QTE48114.1 site-specific integrase [Mucilaginibacter rubeus]QTE59505.1 site-specific integrase [Mucilaginibacter rubeus]
MKTQNNTFGVIFYLRKYKATNDGKAPIYARITVNGHRTDVSVKRSIDPANWNANKGMAKGSKEEVVKLNNYLEQYRSGIVESYQHLLLQKKLITSELVKDKFTGEDQAAFTVCRLIEYHNTEQIQVLEPGTMKNYYTTQKYIQEFIIERFGTKDKYLSELTYKFITDFEYYLRNRTPDKGQKPLNNNGLMKHIERFCKMVNLAVRLEWIDRNPFHAYQLKFDKVEREFLTKDELARIENKHFNIVRLQVVKDLFIFSCYTGLAYIDVFNLTPANLVEKSANNIWIMTNRQKTNEPVKVPLLPKALEIVEKYKGHPQALAEGKVLPTLSNQKLNSYLKEIADMCDITKPLTFHIARHTFATTVTLTNGVPIETVSKLLGHSKLTTTQIYAKVIESKLGDDMVRLSERLRAQ